MTKFALSIAAASAVLFAAAPAAAESSFKHGADTYVYSVSEQSGERVITGKRYPGNSDFRFVVRNGRVSGSVDGRSVAFNAAEAKGAAGEQKVRVSLAN